MIIGFIAMGVFIVLSIIAVIRYWDTLVWLYREDEQ